MERQQSSSSRYRPEIDGLRAVAVVAVIINHFNKALLPSGHLGVDIFFVISGYVITSSLANRQDRHLGAFLSSFVARRIRRLLPALIVYVLITSLLLCLFNPDPGPALETGRWALIGLSNLSLFNTATDYFAQSTELNPFTHTWSLGVEEQFYLVFPFLIWFSGFSRAHRHGRRILFISIAVLAVASLVGFVALYPSQEPAAYFLMPPRFWEMGSGCLAYIAFSADSKPVKALQQLPPLALVSVMAGLMLLPRSLALASTIAMVGVTALLIGCLNANRFSTRVLSSQPALFIGLISYSLYLWHWGVLSLSRWTIGIHWWSVPLQIGGMLLLAWLSYRLIETPFRTPQRAIKPAATIGLGATAVALSGGLLTLLNDRQIQRAVYTGSTSANLMSNAAAQRTEGLVFGNCTVHSANPLRDCVLGGTATQHPQLLLLGDSHAEHLLPLLNALNRQDKLGVSAFISSGQPFPAARYTDNQGRTREQWEQAYADAKRFFEARFDQLQSGDIILLSSRLEYYFIDSKFNRSDQDRRLSFYDASWQPLAGVPEAFWQWRQEVKQLATRARTRGIQIAIMAPLPAFKGLDDNQTIGLCNEEWFRIVPDACHQNGSFSSHRESLVRRYASINKALQSLARESENIHIVDPFDTLCPPSDRCTNRLTNRLTRTLLFRDDDHLSEAGALRLKPLLLRLIQRLPVSAIKPGVDQMTGNFGQ